MKYNTIKSNIGYFTRCVAESASLSEVCRKMSLIPSGGSFRTVKGWVLKLKLDTSHMSGQTWNKNMQFKKLTAYTRNDMRRKHLLRLRGHQCENCQLTEWLGKPIAIECHHIDGDNTNNEEANLQLLCPNCHAQTDNFRNRKRK